MVGMMRGIEIEFYVNGELKRGAILESKIEYIGDDEDWFSELYYTVLEDDYVTTHKIHETDVHCVIY